MAYMKRRPESHPSQGAFVKAIYSNNRREGVQGSAEPVHAEDDRARNGYKDDQQDKSAAAA